MIKNIKHIQIKRIPYNPKMFQAILTYEIPSINYDESDDIEYIKLRELEKDKKNKDYTNIFDFDLTKSSK